MKGIVVLDEGEVLVQTGVGFVSSFTKAEKRNAKLEITSTDPRLQYPLKASVDTLLPLHDVAKAAFDGKFLVNYRIETHRFDGVSADIPIADVEKMKKANRLVSLERAAVAAVPSPNGSAPVDQGDPGPTEPPDDGEHFGATPTGPRMAEGKPWERTNSDGSVNLGSYAITASLGMVELAYELLCQRQRETGKAGTPNGELKGFARMLLDASDRVQAIIRQDHRVDRQDNSHTRARGAVRSVVESTGVPWDSLETLDQKKAWVAFLVEQASGLLALALELDR